MFCRILEPQMLTITWKSGFTTLLLGQPKASGQRKSARTAQTNVTVAKMCSADLAQSGHRCVTQLLPPACMSQGGSPGGWATGHIDGMSSHATAARTLSLSPKLQEHSHIKH